MTKGLLGRPRKLKRKEKEWSEAELLKHFIIIFSVEKRNVFLDTGPECFRP